MTGETDPAGPVRRTAAAAAATVTHRHIQIGATVLVLLAWVVQRVLLGTTPVFPIDDAYITLHNAQVLHGMPENNYAGSAALTGSTSVIHTALVAGLLTVFSPLHALDVSLWLGIVLFALGIARLGQINRATPLQTGLLIFVGLTVARAPHQLLNGLETGLALAGVTWSLALACEKTPTRSLMVVAGLLPFLRPELALMSFLLLGLQVIRQWQATSGDYPVFVRAALADAALLAFAASPWLVLYAVNTGVPYPATMGAKRAYFAEALLPATYKTASVTDGMALFLESVGVLSLGLLALPFSRIGKVGLIFIAGLLAAYWISLPGALMHYEGRYLYVPTLSLLLMGAAQTVGSPRKKGTIAATLLLILSAGQSVVQFPEHWREHLAERQQTTLELADVARFCSQNLPADAPILMHDAGYLAFASNCHLVDFVGLKTPWCISYHEQLTFPSGGAERAEAVSQIAQRSKVRYLVVLAGWDAIFQITPGLRARGWKLEPLRVFPADWPIPTEHRYQIYKITPPTKAAQ